VPYWKSLRDHVKKERPDCKVLLTGGPLFLGMYPKLDELSMNMDAVGHHCYIDRREIPQAFADYALAIGGYASRRNQIPVNSELNWRFITRDTLEQQALHFKEIYEPFLTQQAIPVVMQFQFQETFCVPPKSRGALRHYEVLRFDRTLKPQGYVYRDFVRQYSSSNAPINNLDITIDKQGITPGQQLMVPVTFKNISIQKIEVKSDLVLPDGLKSVDNESLRFSLRPQETKVVNRVIKAEKDLKPGYYHIFEKTAFQDKLFFGWGVLNYQHQPELALDPPAAEDVTYEMGLDGLRAFDLSQVDAVIFGAEAPALEVDWALYVLESLRSATGADIQRFKNTDPEAQKILQSGNLILVGNPKSNAFIARVADAVNEAIHAPEKDAGWVTILDNPFSEGHKILLLSGADEKAVEKAASDFLYRYWRHAKDAITFRVGMHSEQYQAQPVREEAEEDVPLELIIPDQARVGQKIRILVYRSSEPPGPATGKTVWLISNSSRTLLGETSTTGELFYTFEKTGRYEIQAGRSSQSKKIIEIQ
jgi:hypothetical protein